MALKFIAVWSLLHIVQMVESASLAKELVQVDIQCGKTILDKAFVTVKSDNNVDAKLVCKDSKEISLTKTGLLTFRASVSYPGSKAPCIFNQYPSLAYVYTVKLMVAIRGLWKTQLAVQSFEYRYTLSCSLTDYGTEKTISQDIDISKLPSVGIGFDNGGPLKSGITVQVEDARGNKLTGDIPVGKTIRLHSFISKKTLPETSITALDCKAINVKSTYKILIGGCGDGIIISKKQGFRTQGTDVYSPFFSAFRLQGSKQLTFECKFIACKSKSGCDGNSCPYQ